VEVAGQYLKLVLGWGEVVGLAEGGCRVVYRRIVWIDYCEIRKGIFPVAKIRK